MDGNSAQGGAETAASVHLPAPQPVRITGHDTWSNREAFHEQWKDYEIASGLPNKPETIRAATLRTIMGRDCRETLKRLEIPPDDRDKPQVILEKLEEYFKPLRNVIYESFVFNSRKQQPGESIREYVDALQRLAMTCDFGTLRDRLIRDRLVVGCSDEETRARMLHKDSLDLTKAIEMCRAAEAMQRQLPSISDGGSAERQYTGTPDEVHTVCRGQTTSSRFKRSNDRVQNCRYCGQAHEAGKCPAFGTICRNCGKRNHFARVCRQNSVAAQRPGGQRQKPASRPARVNAVEEEASRWVNSAQSAYDETDEVLGFDLCSAFGSDAAKGSK